MNEFEKAQLISEAAAILLLHAKTLQKSAACTLALRELINRLVQENPEIVEKYIHEISALHELIQTTQSNIQKAGQHKVCS